MILALSLPGLPPLHKDWLMMGGACKNLNHLSSFARKIIQLA
jgi:hypothetical protein